MKRKFYLLALTCAVVGTSVISSCKDTDEDLYTDLKNQLAQSENNYQQLRQKLSEIETKLAEKLKEQGPKGDKGDKGDQGEAGANGANGKSAYEIAKDNGFTGTEKEWLESLRGEKGDPGQDAVIDEALKALDALNAKHDKDINEIKELIKALDAAASRLDVAGIIIQNVYNQAYGEFALPLGLQSNALLAYYSTVEKSPMLFPATEFDVEGGLSADEMISLDLEPSYFDLTEHEINVGKVYLTVNPVDGNFAGKTPLIVNTKGEQDGITLSALEACDEVLSFGYTRANTNLYATDAKVTDFGAADKLNLNVVENAKEIRDAVKGKDASKTVRVVYEMIQNLNLKRKAVQLSNTNSTVVSSYDLAAVLVKPLGFETLQKICDSDFMKKLKDLTIDASYNVSVSVNVEDKTGTGTATGTVSGVEKVNRVLSKISNALDNIYARSLPAMIVDKGNEVGLVSVDKNNPTLVDNTITLYPASYSAEILVPYIYKHVAVVKVSGAADNAKAMAAANNAIHMNCILDKTECHNMSIDLAGLESGATYELVYSAMDYDGKVVPQRFYFKVK